MSGSETHIDDMDPTLPEPAPLGKSRQLIPRWLSWLLGGVSLLVTIIVILLWPSVPTLSSTWQPNGPLLGTADWHKSTLNVKDSVKLSRSNIYQQEPYWIRAGNRLFPVLQQADQSQGIHVWMRPSWLMDQPPPMMTNLGWIGLSMSDSQGIAWESPTGLWIPLTGYRLPHALQLLLVDPETLAELDRIELDPGLAPGAASGIAGQIDRVGIADDGTWWLMASLEMLNPNVRNIVKREVAWQFHPESRVVSPPVEIKLPTQAPDGTPVSPTDLGLLGERGLLGSLGYEPKWGLMAEDWPTGSSDPPHFTWTSFPAEPTGPSPVTLLFQGVGLRQSLSNMDLIALTSQGSLSFEQYYRSFQLGDVVRQVAIPVQRTPATGPHLQWRRMSYYGYQAANKLDQELAWQLPHHVAELGPLTTTASWNQFSGDPDLERTLAASLSQMPYVTSYSWDGIPTLEVCALDDRSFLFAQLVLASPHGSLLRFGVLEVGASRIDWVGYTRVPADILAYPHHLNLALYADSEGWLVGLTGVQMTRTTAERAMWWQLVPYPEDWQAQRLRQRQGWLSFDGRARDVREQLLRQQSGR